MSSAALVTYYNLKTGSSRCGKVAIGCIMLIAEGLSMSPRAFHPQLTLHFNSPACSLGITMIPSIYNGPFSNYLALQWNAAAFIVGGPK